MSTLNSILGVDVLPTLKKVQADFKEIEKSVAVFYHRAEKMNKKIQQGLDKSVALNKKYEASASDVKSFKKSKLARDTKKAEGNLKSAFEKSHDLMRQARVADKQMPYLRTKLKDLGKNAGSVDKANIIIGQLINFGLAVAGITDAAAVGQAIQSISLASVGLLQEGVELGKNLEL
jgi:hypothetical protein